MSHTAIAAPHRTKAIRLKRDDVLADGTFCGYGSVFNVQDSGGDIVMPGAFADSLAEHRRRGTSVKLLWQHDPTEPVGIWLDLREDDYGLLCRGRVFTTFDRGRQALDLMRAGAIDGLSIGYECQDWEIEQADGAAAPAPFGMPSVPAVRRLKKINLWEVSLVTFPMNQDARIDVVRGHNPTRPDIAGGIAGLAAAVIARGQALRGLR